MLKQWRVVLGAEGQTSVRYVKAVGLAAAKEAAIEAFRNETGKEATVEFILRCR